MAAKTGNFSMVCKPLWVENEVEIEVEIALSLTVIEIMSETVSEEKDRKNQKIKFFL